MTMILGHCSNPNCHVRYTGDNYSEFMASITFGDGSKDRRIFSVCKKCLAILTNEIVADVVREDIEHETNERNESITVTAEEKAQITKRGALVSVVAWGKDIDELNDKLKDIVN